MRALAFALGATLSLGACSALGLGDHDVISCDPDDIDGHAECDALNAELPADSCNRFYCNPTGRGCVPGKRDDDGDGLPNEVCAKKVPASEIDCDDDDPLRNGSSELCDGVDNDCDEWIDEDSSDLSSELRFLSLDTDFSSVGSTVAPDGTLHVVLTAEPRTGRYETTHVALGDVFEKRGVILDGQQCEGETEGTFIDCQISEMALAATRDVVVGAGIHRLGCPAGQVRVGAGRAAAFDLTLGGRDHAGLAVDLVSSGCSRSSSCEGSRSPAAGVLDASGSMPPEALFVWLAPSAGDSGNCHEPPSFRLAALALPVGATMAEPRLLGMNALRSEPLDERALGAPSVVASSTPQPRGFFVAYPSSDGVDVLFIPQRNGRSRMAERVEATIDATDASSVALTPGESASGRGLALAYVSNERRSLHLVVFEIQGTEDLEELSVSETISLTVEGTVTAGPALAFAPSGFKGSAAPGDRGGWLVTWVESDSARSSRVMAARVAESERRILNERLQLADDDARDTFTYLKQDHDSQVVLRAGYITDDALHARDVSCNIGN